MSHHLVNLAWQEDLNHTPKVVLLALAHMAVPSTGECWPSTRVLSSLCGLSPSAIRTQVILLEKRGLIEVKDVGGLNHYTVKLRASA